MKKSNVIALMLLALISFNTTHAYRWIINNFTSKDLLIKLELLASSNNYWVLIPSEQSADFDWSLGNVMAGFCLDKIKWMIASQKFLNQPWIDKNTMTITDINALENSFTIPANIIMMAIGKLPSEGQTDSYGMKEATLRFLPDEIYNSTVEQAKKLSGTQLGADIVGWFADLVAQSQCRSRDISIIEEENGEINFYTLAN